MLLSSAGVTYLAQRFLEAVTYLGDRSRCDFALELDLQILMELSIRAETE